jgi:hypothetical protein
VRALRAGRGLEPPRPIDRRFDRRLDRRFDRRFDRHARTPARSSTGATCACGRTSPTECLSNNIVISITQLRDFRTACARVRLGQKNNSGAEMDDDAGKLPRPQRRPSIGYHFTEAPRYGSAPAPRCPGAGAPATAPFRLPSNSCWGSSRSGSRGSGAETRRGRRVRGHAEYASRRSFGRSHGLSSGRSRSVSARRDSRWRRRGTGRLDDTMSPVACGRVSSRIMICVF